ncbi:hypothetical protein J7E89_20245 [Streptomyces sp. ISL-100]|nr:hypothetical protein [Streptomyces sp. ISL-100]
MAEVEGELQEHPAVQEATVVGVPDQDGHDKACAVVVPHGTAPTLDELRVFLRERGLTDNYMPTGLVIAPELPRTSLGNVRKNDLRQQIKTGDLVYEGHREGHRQRRILGLRIRPRGCRHRCRMGNAPCIAPTCRTRCCTVGSSGSATPSATPAPKSGYVGHRDVQAQPNESHGVAPGAAVDGGYHLGGRRAADGLEVWRRQVVMRSPPTGSPSTCPLVTTVSS